MKIRKAENKDINSIIDILSEVLDVHAKLRPDIFISGTTKYTYQELEKMIKDDNLYIFVVDLDDVVAGYAICELHQPKFTNTMKQHKIFYIDDFCISSKFRRKHLGEALFNFLKEEAKILRCYEITLAAWEGNEAAEAFYQKMGLKTKYKTLEYII